MVALIQASTGGRPSLLDYPLVRSCPPRWQHVTQYTYSTYQFNQLHTCSHSIERGRRRNIRDCQLRNISKRRWDVVRSKHLDCRCQLQKEPDDTFMGSLRMPTSNGYTHESLVPMTVGTHFIGISRFKCSVYPSASATYAGIVVVM